LLNKEQSMNPRSTLILCVGMVLSCLILGAAFGQRSTAQALGAAPPAVVARYHPLVVGGDLILVDTATGQCWQATATVNGKDKTVWVWKDSMPAVSHEKNGSKE
jgi:hypothetical protein